MTHRERFAALMSYQPFDRVPVYFFGCWGETWERWRREGAGDWAQLPDLTGMDPDWEDGMWNTQGLVNVYPAALCEPAVLEETEAHRLVRTALGAIHKENKLASSIPQHVQEALAPTREDWRRFRSCLEGGDSRYPAGWTQAAEAVDRRVAVTCFLGGSLYAWPREWMGVENLSYLVYDDPTLYEGIISDIADHFIALHRPVLERARFEFAYFFEDCCFSNGPLISPEVYRRYYHRHYRRMIECYHSMGVEHVLVDSDGKVDELIPCWLESGFDIIFPVEVGTWKADPREFRRQYGKQLRMMGGVNKHVIPQGAAALRAHLEPLRDLVAEGGYIPLPDHRIPPDCSFEQFKTYVQVFKEVFGGEL